MLFIYKIPLKFFSMYYNSLKISTFCKLTNLWELRNYRSKFSYLKTFLYSHTSSTVHCSFLKGQDLFSGNVKEAETAYVTSWYECDYSTSKKMWKMLMKTDFVSDASTKSMFFFLFFDNFYSCLTIFSKNNFISLFQINLFSVAITNYNVG